MTTSNGNKDFKSDATSREGATISAAKRTFRVIEGVLFQRKVSALSNIASLFQ